MSKRRPLTEQETLFCTIAFKNIQTRFLHPPQEYLLASLQSQFEWDGNLSDKQLEVLKQLKQRSDHGLRREAIAAGDLDPDYFRKLNKDEYLRTRYSSAGKANLHEIRRRR